MLAQIETPFRADFSEPLELMVDCHRRIEDFLLVLIQLAEELHGGSLDDAHREALERSLNYFRAAAPRHTQDEEESLFPRLRRSHEPAVLAAMAKVDALEEEHRLGERHHARLEVLGQRWLAEDRLDAEALAQLRAVLAELVRLYQRHIRIEDQEVFPLARKYLSPGELREMGEEMRGRRRRHPGRAGSRCARRRLSWIDR